MNPNLSLKEEIEICINSGLTPTELFIVRLLFLAQAGDASLLTNYLSNSVNGKELLKITLNNLLNKGIINKTFKMPSEGEILKFNDIPFNKNFLKRYVRESQELGKEFFDAYPPFIFINGKTVSIRNITKAGLYSMDDFCNFYAKQIKLSSTTHERVMEAIEYAKEHNLINYSILEFISSQKWLEIEYIRDSGEVSGFKNSELL